MLKRLVAICSVSRRIDYSRLKNLQVWWRVICVVHIAVNSWFLTARPALNMASQIKDMPSRVARDVWKLRANGCWGTPWTEKRLVASLTATLQSGIRF